MSCLLRVPILILYSHFPIYCLFVAVCLCFVIFIFASISPFVYFFFRSFAFIPHSGSCVLLSHCYSLLCIRRVPPFQCFGFLFLMLLPCFLLSQFPFSSAPPFFLLLAFSFFIFASYSSFHSTSSALLSSSPAAAPHLFTGNLHKVPTHSHHNSPPRQVAPQSSSRKVTPK